MLGSILIGLDRPDHGEALAALAIRWARQSGAKLVGLAIVDEPGIRAIEPVRPVGGTPGVDPVYYEGYKVRLAEVDRQAERLLEQFAARCAEADVAHTELKAVGSPHELIEQEAQACDLILLARGSHFRCMRRDDEGDETLKRILKDAPRPLVVLPGSTAQDGPAVVAYDGSLQAARALAAFHATGLGKSGQIYIVSVDRSATQAAKHTERARQFLLYHKIEAVPVALGCSTDPAKVMLEQVERLGASLLVMGAYGQPILREFVVGSVTRTMLKHSRVPLFLFH
jgi:nucleotide-binding universal stress UspA family protein